MTSCNHHISRRIFWHYSTSIGLGVLVLTTSALAANPITGPSDVGRIKPELKQPAFDHTQDRQITLPSTGSATTPPEGAKKIHLVFKKLETPGVTVFKLDDLKPIYAEYLGKNITLDKAYAIADKITERYRQAGYFLSLAYVPPQHINNGTITIKVVEGSIGKVELNSDLEKHRVVRSYIDKLIAQKPLKSDVMESFLLRMNDLPGVSFRSVLAPLEGSEEGTLKLSLIPTTKEDKGSISFDNYGSRYLGPNEASASYSTSLLPLQQTSVSGLTSLPADSLHYATIEHSVVIAPDITLGVNANTTRAQPGYTLKPDDIKSRSAYSGINLDWHYVRQREENLNFRFTVDGRNTYSNILGDPLTRDRVRALRVNTTYDKFDSWQGYNIASITMSHGINGLGSNDANDKHLSNPRANPDFSKAELNLSRQQYVTKDWSLLLATSGQISSQGLYTSEQFGYGGQAFGRAYDTSTITGDEGLVGSVELRYGGFNIWQDVAIMPYTFYDIGQVWQKTKTNQSPHESGASAGFGLRANTSIGLSGNLGLAWPLTQEISAPVYGETNNGPRIALQLSQGF